MITINAAPVGATSPRVLLDVTSSPVVTDALSIVRVHADGSEHPVLGVGTLIETWTGVDFHAPFNQPVTYRATAGGSTAASAPVLLLSDRSWLIHPSDPDLSTMIEIIATVDSYTSQSSSTTYRPLGSRLPVIRTDFPMGGESGQITIICTTPQNRAALNACLRHGGPVLLNTPYTDDDIGWMWVAFDSRSIGNPGGRQSYPDRRVTLPYREVAAPDVDTGVWTLGELKARSITEYPTLGDLKAAYTGLTLRDLKLRAR